MVALRRYEVTDLLFGERVDPYAKPKRYFTRNRTLGAAKCAECRARISRPARLTTYTNWGTE